MRDAYLELLKRSILGLTVGPVTLYHPVPDEPRRPTWRQRLAAAISDEGADPRGVLAEPVRYDLADNVDGSVSVWGLPPWPVSMIGQRRMDNLRDCLEVVLQDDVEGDVIETGVWKGGAAIFMRGVLRAHGVTDRRVYVADSFEGLPVPDLERYPQDEGLHLHLWPNLAVSLEEVRGNFERYDLLDEQVVFVKGWFRDSLPTLHDRRWALVRLDGDYYESTMDALVNLEPNVSPGGFVIIDDHQIPACAQAVADYRELNGINAPIEPIDWTGVFWRKDP